MQQYRCKHRLSSQSNAIRGDEVAMSSQVDSIAAVDSPAKIYRSLGCTGDLSYEIAKLLRCQIPNLVLGQKCPKTVASVFSRLKDPVDKWHRSNVVYEIPCSGCGKKYVGVTSCLIKQRISGHKSDRNKWLVIKDGFEKTEKLDNDNPYKTRQFEALDREKNTIDARTAAIKHCIDTQHMFEYDDTRILVQEQTLSKLSTLEMLHINDKRTVNIKTDTLGLHNSYKGILHKLSNKDH